MVVDRDPRPPLREGYAHTHRGDEEGGLRMEGVPHCMVGTSRKGESGVGPMNS